MFSQANLQGYSDTHQEILEDTALYPNINKGLNKHKHGLFTLHLEMSSIETFFEDAWTTVWLY